MVKTFPDSQVGSVQPGTCNQDFNNLIPGHGGMMDRFDCQFVMHLSESSYVTACARCSSSLKSPMLRFLCTYVHIRTFCQTPVTAGPKDRVALVVPRFDFHNDQVEMLLATAVGCLAHATPVRDSLVKKGLR